MRRFGPKGEKNACAGTKRCLFAVCFFVMRWLAVADIAGAAVRRSGMSVRIGSHKQGASGQISMRIAGL